MGREHNCWIGVIRPGGKHVESIALDGDLLRVVSKLAEFSVKIISDRSFIPRNRFDVDELSSERDCVHAGENSKAQVPKPRSLSP